MHKYLPGFRTPFELAINYIFFEPLETRDKIISMLKNGFTADWGPELPSPWGPITNYFTKDVIQKCRKRFHEETTKGRMIGGPG